ncbi:PREDICTED: uncharacterized protein LOC107335688 [Acropora digitifera]|uniref:uncharacterized protein LOC107335688 n=1 Tax=Acropora digitifera TaxID=70779 RepID=UPI000779FEE9|nr:PREDICTED: uncharacterized protein LOC107335688 [Acropora digitifera]
MVDFQIQLFDAVKELEEGVKDLGSQQEMKKREFKTFKEEMKDGMRQKNADLVELTEELRELQVSMKLINIKRYNYVLPFVVLFLIHSLTNKFPPHKQPIRIFSHATCTTQSVFYDNLLSLN